MRMNFYEDVDGWHWASNGFVSEAYPSKAEAKVAHLETLKMEYEVTEGN